MNWLDIVILLIIAVFAFLGTRSGLIVGMLELLGIVVSIGIPFLLYPQVAHLLQGLGVSKANSTALAFLLLWLVFMVLYFWTVRRIYRHAPESVIRSSANRALGVVPGAVKGALVVALILTVIATLPRPPIDQKVVEQSRLGRSMLDIVMSVSSTAESIFGQAVHNAIGFLTIEPKTDERLDLHFTVASPTIDTSAESQMLKLVNKERVARGLVPLVIDARIVPVARAHSIDMLKRGYFAHSTPEGVTPMQRMLRGGVRFTLMGENLAYAPSVQIAHEGLMQSPGHRANILNPAFRRVGIGVARGGRYRMMFTQDFAR